MKEKKIGHENVKCKRGREDKADWIADKKKAKGNYKKKTRKNYDEDEITEKKVRERKPVKNN